MNEYYVVHKLSDLISRPVMKQNYQIRNYRSTLLAYGSRWKQWTGHLRRRWASVPPKRSSAASWTTWRKTTLIWSSTFPWGTVEVAGSPPSSPRATGQDAWPSTTPSRSSSTSSAPSSLSRSNSLVCCCSLRTILSFLLDVNVRVDWSSGSSSDRSGSTSENAHRQHDVPDAGPSAG